jgi:hypothetical protein
MTTTEKSTYKFLLTFRKTVKFLDNLLLKSEIAALVFAVLGAGILLFGLIYLGDGTQHTWKKVYSDLYTNFGTEFISIAITVLTIDVLNKRREAKLRKHQLILQISSPSNAFSLEAVRLMKYEKWLYDGTLKNAILRSANLDSADLSKSYLAKVDLWEANLQSADLSSSTLDGANLWEANLSNADIRNASLVKTHLFMANLRGADLSGANLDSALLRDTNLQNALFCSASGENGKMDIKNKTLS